jgi:aryl-alcohol dehydrogenase-like predicted oxidoreductase
MPLDYYVTLGRSGLRVSPFCLGAMTFGDDFGWGSSVTESEAIIDRFLAAGGNFIDTANLYTKGHSETIIGDHLTHDKAKRDRIVLATKFSGNHYPGDPNGGGSSRKAIIGACEQSLRRLRTDYIDLYWLHMWDRNTPIDETMAALHDLVQAGKVRYIGVSDTPAWKITQAQLIAQFRGWTPFIGLQIEYSLLERTVEGELIPMAIELGMGVTPWSPLKGGVLTGKHHRPTGSEEASKRPWMAGRIPPGSEVIVDELISIADEVGSTPARVAIAWVQGRSGVASTILGARTMAQLEDNLQAIDVQLHPEQVARLDALTKPALNFPGEFLPMAPTMQNGGATVNGDVSTPSAFGVTVPGDHY